MKRSHALAGVALMVLAACGNESPNDLPVGKAHPLIRVYGTDMGGVFENVGVLREDGTAIPDAIVEVNGEPLGVSTVNGLYYYGTLSVARSAGQTIALRVTAEGATVTGTGIVPEEPVLLAPADGATLPPGADVSVSWTSSATPDRFEVWAMWPCGPSCGAGRSFVASGSSRAFTIPGDAIPSGDVTIAVFAYEDGALAGDYLPFASYPGMNIRAESSDVVVSR
jgi:hypothetical protein